MFNRKKNVSILIITILAIFGILGIYFYQSKTASPPVLDELTDLKNKQPELEKFIDKIKEAQDKVEKEPENVKNFFMLGLCWKGLADKTLDKKFYMEALNIYEKAIDLTNRKNTVALANAGNMNCYLDNYDKAEKYYQEAIDVSPGDMDLYLKLVELYRYKLKKGENEIVEIFDKGIARMIDPKPLIIRKTLYLQEIYDDNQ